MIHPESISVMLNSFFLGTIVTTVQVSGVHVGVHYFLEPERAAPNQNGVNWFHIDNTTGVITVAKALDREVHP